MAICKINEKKNKLLKKIKIKDGEIFIKDVLLKDANKNYQSWFNYKHNFKFIEKSKYKPSIKYLKIYIKNFRQNQHKKLIGIFYKKNLHIGNISLTRISFLKKSLFLGIFIGNPKYRGRGIGSKSIYMITNYLIKNTFIEKIYLGVKKDNINAIRAYKKNNFKIFRKKSLGYLMLLKKNMYKI